MDPDMFAVVLDFDVLGRRTITWAMDGYVEGLSFLSANFAYSGVDDETVDASNCEAWRIISAASGEARSLRGNVRRPSFVC